MRRSMKKKLVGVCVLMLAITACLGGVAFAQAGHTKANIQEGNNSCGANEPSLPVLGTVSFTRSGEIVTLKVKIKHGKPNTTYGVELLWKCTFIDASFSIKTNKKGVGKGSGSGNVGPPNEDTEFLAVVDPELSSGAEVNMTPSVNLLP
jgi:hypothetical protein